MWRYREALPIGGDVPIVSMGEGFTPLLPVELDGRRLHLKLDFLFPTGSYKDRGASVLISRARELGVRAVVEDSSGNAGCAVAAYAARAGITCDIFVPEAASPAKTVQIGMYGARLHRVPGTRERTAEAAQRAAGTAFYASHVWNPFFLHGTKTFAYEVWEQLGFSAPDALVLPAGNGTLLIGAYIGFCDLLMCGLIERMPRLVAVQAERCAPLYYMYSRTAGAADPIQRANTVPRKGGSQANKLTAPETAAQGATAQETEETTTSETVANETVANETVANETVANETVAKERTAKETIAEGIAIAEPPRARQMLGIVRETGGEVIAVTDDEIVAALVELCRMGFYIEPTAAAAVAGFRRWARLSSGGITVVPLTGHGLKSTEKLLYIAGS